MAKNALGRVDFKQAEPELPLQSELVTSLVAAATHLRRLRPSSPRRGHPASLRSFFPGREEGDGLHGFEGVVDPARQLEAVFALNDPITLRSRAKAREAGQLRIEGKEYVVQDRDVI